jgi:BirA family biotin operon repressor/biotin-[acetyl-CoA-carboxylase] ligase
VELALKIANPWEGAPVFVKERTSSTMDDALALARSGYPPGTAVIAGSQERGRGRLPGRRWQDSPWKSLLVSVFIRQADIRFSPALLPMASAVAVCRAAEAWLSERALVKWPNDVRVRDKKLAGILCESRGGWLIVGFGINCNQKKFPAELSRTACSLRQASGREIPVFDLCARLLAEQKRILGDGGWMDELETRLALRGRRVAARAPGSDEVVIGAVDGVDGNGGLVLLLDDGGRRTVFQAEISENP